VAATQPSLSRTVATPTASTEKPKIGTVKEPFVDGCVCYFQFPGDFNKEGNGYVFLVDIVEKEGGAQMNIDGKDLR
jgi:hypothetical protein